MYKQVQGYSVSDPIIIGDKEFELTDIQGEIKYEVCR